LGRVIEVSPNGRFLVSTISGPKLTIQDTGTGREIGAPLATPRADGALEIVTQVVFSPDSRLVFIKWMSGGRIYETETGRFRAELASPGLFGKATFAPDGRFLATPYGNGDVQHWDCNTGRSTGAPLTHTGAIHAIAFSPDGRLLLVGTGTDPSGSGTKYSGASYLWDIATRLPIGEAIAHPDHVQLAAFSPDGSTYLTGSYRGPARLWKTPVALEGDASAIMADVQEMTNLEFDANFNIRRSEIGQRREAWSNPNGLGAVR
jgi:WD40 repeat protein